MEQYLSFVTIDLWTLIFTWINLLILFFILKKLLVKPMQKMLDERAKEIQSSYDKADEAKNEAEKLKSDYEERMASAHEKAECILSEAVQNASLRSDMIVKEAHEKATDMIERAEKNIEAQKESAFNSLKGEISSMAVDIAKKVIQKDINEKDHEKLIDSALEGLGE